VRAHRSSTVRTRPDGPPPAPPPPGPAAWAAVRCPGCQTAAWAPLSQQIGPYALYTCPACALSFSVPMRAADASFYAAIAHYEDRWEFHWVARRLAAQGLGGALLDIGCGDGRFLARLAGRFTVMGLDLNPAAIQRARAMWGLTDVHVLTLEDFALSQPARRFEVITAFHVLEHVADPDGLIATMATCLRPGGVLVLAVPNPGRWARRWCREQWDEPPHHLTRWTPGALATLLGRHGFAVRAQQVEPLRRLRQLHSAWCDLLWEGWRQLTPHLGLGWALQPEPGTGRTAVARRLRQVALTLIAWLAVGPAVVTYPLVRRGTAEGKGLVLIAARPVPGRPVWGFERAENWPIRVQETPTPPGQDALRSAGDGLARCRCGPAR
jgi:SAM-dependent methyltransferase